MAKTQNHKFKQDCLFCKIIQGEEPGHKILETDQVYAFLDIYPKAKGHTLIIPKDHSVNLLDAPEEDICAVMKTTKKLANKYQEILGADGFIVKIHNNEIANQIIPHFHVHLIPAYKKSDKTSFKERASQEQLKAVAKTITSHLQAE